MHWRDSAELRSNWCLQCGKIESPCIQSSPVPLDTELHSLETEDDDTLDVTAEMAALGLPSSFIARLDRSPSTRKKSKRKRSASRKLDSFTEIPELGPTYDNPKPFLFLHFSIPSVRSCSALSLDSLRSMDEVQKWISNWFIRFGRFSVLVFEV